MLRAFSVLASLCAASRAVLGIIEFIACGALYLRTPTPAGHCRPSKAALSCSHTSAWRAAVLTSHSSGRLRRRLIPALALMKSLLSFIILIAIQSGAMACERSLVGTWKSDGHATMAFVRENSKIQQKTEDFLQALVGHMTLTFSKNELHSVMPNIQVPVAGHLRPFAGSDERKPYKVLFCSNSMIVWSAKRSFGTTDTATTFNFVGPNTVWVYTGSTEPNVPDLHGREYFQRVR
jgi:hypothetical protein